MQSRQARRWPTLLPCCCCCCCCRTIAAERYVDTSRKEKKRKEKKNRLNGLSLTFVEEQPRRIRSFAKRTSIETIFGSFRFFPLYLISKHFSRLFLLSPFRPICSHWNQLLFEKKKKSPCDLFNPLSCTTIWFAFKSGFYESMNGLTDWCSFSVQSLCKWLAFVLCDLYNFVEWLTVFVWGGGGGGF